MGYGGVFKKVVRIAVPVVVGLAGGGPLAVAISSAATTGATGGSFKEALISGATSYIGSSISQGINSTIGTATNTVGPPTAFQDALVNANDAITGTFSEFAPAATDLGFGGFTEAGQTFFRGAGDVLNEIGGSVLGVEALGEGIAAAATPTVLGSLVGGAASLTLEQALVMGDPAADEELLAQGYTPQQIEYLRNEARNRLSNEAFDQVLSNTANPFIRSGQDEAQRQAAEAEFKKVIAAGIERENINLGDQVTRQEFDTTFNDPNLGQNILADETNLRRQKFTQDVNTLFNGQGFEPLKDPDMVSSIVDEQAAPAFSSIANIEARGNLNQLGGKTAREYISGQRPAAEQRVTSLQDQLLGERQRDVSGIKGEALGQIGQFQLGDDAFDINPFKERRQDIIDTTQQNLGTDVRNLLGQEQLFNSATAINKAGTAQGLVSGTGGASNPALLDQLAARAARRSDRGLGSRGSGVF